jgi:hypothetical protein
MSSWEVVLIARKGWLIGRQHRIKLAIRLQLSRHIHLPMQQLIILGNMQFF